MYQAIVAFERKSNCGRIRELLESTGEFSCLVCRSADQIKRAVRKLRLDLVVCGFKLGAESCESIYHDLPQRCVVLMVAPRPSWICVKGRVSSSCPPPSGAQSCWRRRGCWPRWDRAEIAPVSSAPRRSGSWWSRPRVCSSGAAA